MIYLIISEHEIVNEYHESDFTNVYIHTSPLKRLQAFCKTQNTKKLLMNPSLYLAELSGNNITKVFSIPEIKKMLLLL